MKAHSVPVGLGDRRCRSGDRCFEQPEEGGPVVTCVDCAHDRFWTPAASGEKAAGEFRGRAGKWESQCPTCRAYKVEIPGK